MIEIKTLNGKLNLDDSYYRLPKEDYIDALNITHDAVEGSQDIVVSNIVGNTKVDNIYFIKIYNENTSGYNFTAVILNNGNDTETVTLTFNELPAPPITELKFSYFLGGEWVNSTTGYTSPQSITIPIGSTLYKIRLEPIGDEYNLTEDANSVINKTIGAYPNNIRNTVIYFNWNYSGYHAIYEFNKTTREITPILINLIDTGDIDILGFTENNKINSVNIITRDEGDLLFFLDSLGRPTGMNIESMRSGVYTPVTRDIIDVAKNVPQAPPLCVYGNDNTKEINYLRKKFFRFKYIWEDDDFFMTTCSPISKMPMPIDIFDEDTVNIPTQNNIIYVSLNSGGKEIKRVKLLMSYSENSNTWSDFELVKSIDKAEESIPDNIDFSFSFYNESTYPVFDIKHSILLFDYIPIYAKSQDAPNGNVLAYGAITEGYDNDLVPNVEIGIGTYELSSIASGSLTETTTVSAQLFRNIAHTTFEGIPAAGTTIEITVKRKSDDTYVTGALYTTVAGDTNASAMNGTVGSFITYGIFDSQAYDGSKTVTYEFSLSLYYADIIVNITPPSSAATFNSVPVFPWSSQRTIGIAYFDKKGKTNGVVYSAQVIFAPYADNPLSGGVLFSSISISIYHVPPEWAVSYQFLFTKDNTGYFFFACSNVNKAESEYMYFDVTGLKINAEKKPTTANVVNYSFSDGDRLRVIKKIGDIVWFNNDFDIDILGLVSDPVIGGQPQTGKQFIKIKKNSFFSDTNFDSNEPYEIQLWRPQQQTASGENKTQTFFECGLQYDILNPGTSQRVHQGQLQDQTTNYVTPATFLIKEGDAYFRVRSSFLTNTGVATYNVIDKNIVDNYISAVSSLDGRPNLIDPNAKRTKFGATIRHGQAFQPNTNINGLNRFYYESFLDVDSSYGDIERLKIRDRFMRCFQTLKTGMIPIYSQITIGKDGTTINADTGNLLNPIQYYIGDWGIGTAPESLASFNFADYFCDNIRGAICRVSNSGVETISILHKVNSWATSQLPLRKDNYKIYGSFEQKQNNYIVALESTQTAESKTIVFDTERNCFDSFISFYPEMMVNLGVLFIGFKNGDLWTHDNTGYNNFFGIQYDSSITAIFNQLEIQKKTFISVSELSSQIWDCPEIETSSNVYGTIKQISELSVVDFEEKEGDYHAGFLRASNSQGGLIEGDSLKGNLIKINFRAKMQEPPNNDLVTLNLVSVSNIVSPLTNK